MMLFSPLPLPLPFFVLGLLLQLMKAIIYALVWKMASRGDNLASLCPTVLSVYSYFGYLLIAASLNKRIELNKIHLYFMFQKFHWTVKLIYRKNSPFQRFRINLSSIFYTEHLQLNERFFSAGNSSHLNYGQRGNWNLMERTIPKTLYTHYPR